MVRNRTEKGKKMNIKEYFKNQLFHMIMEENNEEDEEKKRKEKARKEEARKRRDWPEEVENKDKSRSRGE